jgi:hypothetical protein
MAVSPPMQVAEEELQAPTVTDDGQDDIMSRIRRGSVFDIDV